MTAILPKIKYPTYTFIRPSDDKKISFRPFNAMEEKILLMSREGNDKSDIYDATLQVLNNCIISPEKEDITKWSTFDVELFFIKVRAKSIGEEIEVVYTDDKGKKHDAVLLLEEVKVNLTSDQKKKKYRTIMIDSDIGLTLRWPHFKQLFEFAMYCRAVSEGEIPDITEKDLLLKSFEFYSDLVETIFQGDIITNKEDVDKKDLVEFISELPIEKYNELQKFLEIIPTVVYKGKYLDKNEWKEFEVKGFVDFFSL